MLRSTAAGLVVAALVAGGCGSSTVSGSSAQPAPTEGGTRFLASAATKSTSTPSMKTDLSVTMLSTKLPGGQLTMTANGALDNENHRMAVRLDLSSFASAFGGAAALGGASDWVGEQVGDFGGGRAVLYVRLPVLTKVLPGGRPWIKLDLARIGSRAGIDVSQFTQFSNDPSRMIDWLRATGDVTAVGTEKVDGVETTHYKATVDLEKYPNLVPAGQRDAVRKALDAITKATHQSKIPMHVWVGKDGLVRQVRTVVTQSVRGETVNVVTSERFYDFGAPVDIALPAADQVTDISSLGG